MIGTDLDASDKQIIIDPNNHKDQCTIDFLLSIAKFKPEALKSWHIHIEGQVQGVGFRPFVYQLARQQQLCGWVNNTVDGVHIAFNATAKQADNFCETILRDAPDLARISRYRLTETEPREFTRFRIVHSRTEGQANLLLTPDFALCPACRRELRDPENRRSGYPFITCTHCGPRYSIIRQLPYDRETTAMTTFSMCTACRQEYENPDDRRYYAQTNSCPNCQITLSLIDAQGNTVSQDSETIIPQVVRWWEAGKIIAIKGIGGYLLTCDANHAEAIRNLRERKFRPTKPFALMYPDLEQIRQQLDLPAAAAAELLSTRSPIVLLAQKSTTDTFMATADIAPGLSKIGVMLPYTPLFDRLLRAFGRPIVATSANISQAPIIFTEDKARTDLLPIADYLLSNNRDIVVPQDDSVIQYTPLAGQKIILRRSRGMAPTFLQVGVQWPEQTILATGAMLKSTFSLLHSGNTYVSQYLGDLQHFDTEQSYRHCLQHFFQLFTAQPELILTDTHPAYASTLYGQELAATLQVPVRQIQHHLAHFGAILGEHQLLHQSEPVLGVIWDGTGLGDDGQIWGGEFFKYENYAFQRSCHFNYFPFILGDKMPREPRISALAACWDVEGAETFLRAKFSDLEWQLYRKLLEKDSPLLTSSLGRIFDAVAALLGLGDHQSYEGEAAMHLEDLAWSYCFQRGPDFSDVYFRESDHCDHIPTQTLMSDIILDLQKGKPAAYIAAKFHYSLVRLVRIIADHLQIRQIAFSGGVFQNSLLVDLLLHHLGHDFQLYFHRDLSPNDENISYGQLVCYEISRQSTVGSLSKAKSRTAGRDGSRSLLPIEA